MILEREISDCSHYPGSVLEKELRAHGQAGRQAGECAGTSAWLLAAFTRAFMPLLPLLSQLDLLAVKGYKNLILLDSTLKACTSHHARAGLFCERGGGGCGCSAPEEGEILARLPSWSHHWPAESINEA